METWWVQFVSRPHLQAHLTHDCRSSSSAAFTEQKTHSLSQLSPTIADKGLALRTLPKHTRLGPTGILSHQNTQAKLIFCCGWDFPVPHGNFLFVNWNFPMVNCNSPIVNCNFPMVNCNFPMVNCNWRPILMEKIRVQSPKAQSPGLLAGMRGRVVAAVALGWLRLLCLCSSVTPQGATELSALRSNLGKTLKGGSTQKNLLVTYGGRLLDLGTLAHEHWSNNPMCAAVTDVPPVTHLSAD